jgi:DNA (cytosine-5)-methyltransferase 1
MKRNTDRATCDDVEKRKRKRRKIAAVDVFCGAGGLSKGLVSEGIDVVAGIDADPACRYPYERNNPGKFIEKKVEELSSADVERLYPADAVKLLAGCAPCQPFSTYTQGRSKRDDAKWELLKSFGELVGEIRPEIVTMENVPKLAEQTICQTFIDDLIRMEYHVFINPAVDCMAFGVPQTRKRLVLLASLLGPISLEVPETDPDRMPTVRSAIGHLPPIGAGEVCATDLLHRSSQLSEINIKRMKSSRPGGTWRDWNKKLVTKCHKKSSGKSYPSVYGRMEWDEPAPTITTQFYGFGNGRFGHPEQDRALSLREGALLQTFPQDYEFVAADDETYIKTVGRMIGNAVPVLLARAIGRSIIRHVSSHGLV